MVNRQIVAAGVIALLALAAPCVASNPDASALKAVADILFGTNEGEAKLHIAVGATFGAQESGSLVRGLEARSWSEPIASRVEHVTFFDAKELPTLAKTFPNPMWAHAEKQLGSRRGVSVRFLFAESSAIGSRPSGTPGMMLCVIGNDEKIVHLSSDDEK